MKIIIGFAILLTPASFTAGYAQTPDKAKLDQFFDRLAEKNKTMGSLIIAKGGNVLCTRTIGHSQINGTEKKPLTAAARTRIGSITKMFTAVKILQFIEEGKFKPTDTLEATAQDNFIVDPGSIDIEFDAAKNPMTINRNRGERVFTKGK